LSYKIFPKPKETSHQIYSEFGDQFRSSFDEQIRDLKALDAPTEAELSKEAGPNVLRNQPNTSIPGQSGDQAAKRIVDAFCIKRAQELSVYINPKHFPWYGFWEKYSFQGEDQAIRDCWNSQVAFWVYEDVLATIRMLNQGSPSVYSSPAKRLVGVGFMGPVDLKKVGGSGSGGGFEGGFETLRDEPTYVFGPGSPGAAGGSSGYGYTDYSMSPTTLPWTSRASSPEIDVIHFYIGVVVDAKSVYGFMQELCSEKPHRFRTGFLATGKEVEYKHNSITILGSRVEPVERNDPEHARYRYGPGAVVYLHLECEYLFHRSGYDSIQPDLIKKALGITTANPAGGNTTTPTAPPIAAPRDRR
jgi:hypothetical protein